MVSWSLNTLAPGKFEWNFRHVIFKQILVIDDWGISCEIALIWMSLDFTDGQSTLVEVMACCRQATSLAAASHYLSQCWPKSLSPNVVTWPKWVNNIPQDWFSFNTLRPRQNGRHFADNVLKCNFLNESYEFRLKFYWSLLIRVKLTIFHHWFR